MCNTLGRRTCTPSHRRGTSSCVSASRMSTVEPHNRRRARWDPQVRVHARDLRVLHRAGERREPALGPPLERVLAPDGLVLVRGEQADRDRRVLWHRDLADLAPVDAADRLREREDDVLACSTFAARINRGHMSLERRRRAYSLKTVATGACLRGWTSVGDIGEENAGQVLTGAVFRGTPRRGTGAPRAHRSRGPPRPKPRGSPRGASLARPGARRAARA